MRTSWTAVWTSVAVVVVCVCGGAWGRVLTAESIPEPLARMEYAVRGAVVAHALELGAQLEADPASLPFDELIYCNIGNPQALGQKPITFFRSVLAVLEMPSLADAGVFPADVVARARTLLAGSRGTGAYTHSKGLPHVRQRVADFIARRDGVAADPEAIFLTDGASPAIQAVLAHLVGAPSDGVLVPLPQYPLYSGAIVGLGGQLLGYHLDEELGWGLDVDELERVVADAKARGVTPKGMVVINPGNPTGQVLSRAEMAAIVAFCAKHNLVLLADEVYQVNVYEPETHPWHSFKAVLADAAPAIADSVELFSFHSISKGVIGECGHRGGYMEIVNVDPAVVAQLYKYRSISLCSNTAGQFLVELMTNPPVPGDESYPLYAEETNGIFDSLKRRAAKVTAALDALPGVTVRRSPGALYAFPRFVLPAAAVAAAADANVTPDLFYALALLDATGIVIVPGSGFKDPSETGAPFHFRTTFLPSEDAIDAFVDRFTAFHVAFIDQYGGLAHEDL